RFEDIGSAPKALILILPVIAVSVIGRAIAAFVVSGVAALTFGYVVPPFGSVRISLEQDLIAFVVFLLVSAVISTLVARRIELLGEVERHRALLLRSVSHDFRTPLTAINAAASELRFPELHEPSMRDRLLTIIEHETERLDRLVHNMLDLSRI